MKLVKYFDIHDKEVTSVVYTLFFALEEIRGNDLVYKCYTESWNVEDGWDDECYKRLNEYYQKHLYRGSNNFYHNHLAMKAFCENPPTIKEAMAQCWQWLKDQGVTKDDEFFLVKIWW